MFDNEINCNPFLNTNNGGIDIDPATGTVIIADYEGNSIFSYNEHSNFIGCLATDYEEAFEPTGVAFNSNNNTWFISTSTCYIYECTTNAFNDCWLVNNDYDNTGICPYYAIAADSSGNVYGYDNQGWSVVKCTTTTNSSCAYWIDNVVVDGSELCYCAGYSGIAIANDVLYMYDVCYNRIVVCSTKKPNACKSYINSDDAFGEYGYTLNGVYYVPTISIDKSNGILFMAVWGTSIFAYFDKKLVEVGYCDRYFAPSAHSNSSLVSHLTSCFSGDETVQLPDLTKKHLQDVSIGDVILTADRDMRMSYAEVVAIPHKRNQYEAEFLHITVASGEDLKLTSDHILLSGSCAKNIYFLVQASEVSVGDCVRTATGHAAVTDIHIVRGKGLYSVVTENEFIVVNGIIASPFATSHGAGQILYYLYRLLWQVFPISLGSELMQSMLSFTGDVLSSFMKVLFVS